ncbi:DUF445 domain-containing protein [Leisingera sp. NJS204]|uniref:DUF445 domain-containing protein n=1 Tax=Leisingera sp. NJS204 TaxID=2508307 RepID=UPI001012A1FD|nr:DUF445 domain-containing protein [Leisingera sp. NJS204]QAX30756.1 DUF445 domain-containing protein [Leisingera sp. NJS204]
MRPKPDEALRRAGLTRLRRFATGTLAVLALTYSATFFGGTPAGWVMTVRAMSEAGIIGGLADWFAVEALFRRPLGLPIPHTALLPRNQARVATSVGRFIEEHFLEPRRLVEKMTAADLVKRGLVWIENEGGARMIARRVARLLGSDAPKPLLRPFENAVIDLVRNTVSDPASARALADVASTLIKAGAKGGILDATLALVRESIDENREVALQIVQDRSRWWISSQVDRIAANTVVDGVLSVIDEMSEPNSQLRLGFEDAVNDVVARLSESGRLENALHDALAELSGTNSFGERIRGLLRQIERKTVLAAHDGTLEKRLERAFLRTAGEMRSDPEAIERLEASAIGAAESIVLELRPVIGRYVEQTIAEWDSELLISRFEAEVGRDLQFIRLNGAALGACLGGLLHGVEGLLAGAAG